MNVDMFAQQIQAIHWRLTELYENANSAVPPQSDSLLPIAFKELGTASEELQVAAEELVSKTEELLSIRVQREAERQRYQDLFEFLPNAYLVTDEQGQIQEANRAAATLLNVSQPFLAGKPLSLFVPEQERRAFRFKLSRLEQSDWVQEWTVCLQPRNGEIFDAALTVGVIRDWEGNVISLRWILRDVTEQKRALNVLKSNELDFRQHRPLHFYSKGEVISLKSKALWIVCQGVVKLTTVNESGEEVLLGLAGPSMPFGSSMTSLATYQATALSKDVQLVCIPLTEIAASPSLSQALLPRISERLRQTESLLAVSGKRQVKERLQYLLLLLKREIGQPVAQGTRLSVRLTHQELADACCTTRVTITRLVSQLKKQGKIMFDSKHHIVLVHMPPVSQTEFSDL